MSTRLQPGDRVSFLSPTGSGRKLKGVVVDSMEFRARGEELMIPVQRHFNRKHAHCKLDGQKEPRTRWFPRSKLRKLPK